MLPIGQIAIESTLLPNAKLKKVDSDLHIIIRALMEELGYPVAGLLGLCDGFVMVGMLAFFDDRIKETNSLNKYIEEDLAFCNFEKIKMRLKYQNRQVSTDEEKIMVATLDFFDDIALHQTHLLSSRLFNNRDFQKTVTKQQIEQEVGLCNIMLSTTSTYDEFIAYFTLLQECVKKSEIPVAIKIEMGYSSPNSRTSFEAHVICTCYNPVSKNWSLIDISQGQINEKHSLDDLLQFVFNACKIIDKQFTIFLTNLYSKMQNKDLLNQISKQISCSLNSTVSEESTIGLSYYQKLALQDLGKEGLTARHLRSWHADRGFFGSAHIEGLAYLIRKCGLQPKKAVKELCDLERDQVEAITRGLVREEVIGLHNFQILTLEAYKKHGLTAIILRKWSGDFFSPEHYAALGCLLEKHHIQPEAAILELSGLNVDQVRSMISKWNKNFDIS